MRGIELSGHLAEVPQSKILDQVRNGVFVRKAILSRALSASPPTIQLGNTPLAKPHE